MYGQQVNHDQCEATSAGGAIHSSWVTQERFPFGATPVRGIFCNWAYSPLSPLGALTQSVNAQHYVMHSINATGQTSFISVHFSNWCQKAHHFFSCFSAAAIFA